MISVDVKAECPSAQIKSRFGGTLWKDRHVDVWQEQGLGCGVVVVFRQL